VIVLTLAMVAIITVAIWMQMNVFKNLPDVSEVKDMTFSQATIITDKHGTELYKFFSENREYIEFEKINENMVNAIISIEDQRYWEHEGLDPWGIFRAAVTRKGGASTIQQQLMTNVFKLKAGMGASIQKRVVYKLRQMVLAKRLNATLQKQIKQEKPNLSSEEIKHEMKKKVLELYLNYVELGNNSFGIEAASKSYLGKSSSELSALEAAILASLFRGPTQYSPLTEKGRNNLIGYFVITDSSGKEYPYESILQQEIITKFKSAIESASFANKTASNSSTLFLVGLGSFNLVVEGKEYYIKYNNGRKDVVLSRMFEDGHLTEEQLKQAFMDALTVKFQASAFPIKAPHFVFWIKEELEKIYGADFILAKGLIVTTSLDYEIQKAAESVFRDNERTLYSNGANNSSMIYLDTDNGDILAYVGSLNYFNEEIQ
jgi:membrane peptidoglycan carboxypeptidase